MKKILNFDTLYKTNPNDDSYNCVMALNTPLKKVKSIKLVSCEFRHAAPPVLLQPIDQIIFLYFPGVPNQEVNPNGWLGHFKCDLS